jgi:hypothetical protein
MDWVCVYLTLVKNLPVLGVGEEDYKTEEACINANVGTNDTFWCVTRNWLGGSAKTRACCDRLNIVEWAAWLTVMRGATEEPDKLYESTQA